MKIFTYKESSQWNEYVKSFANWNVYYLCEYAVSFMIHGDGEPVLICYEDENVRMCYVVMKKDIADCKHFKCELKSGVYFDLETPYGYGGPLVDGEFSELSQKEFKNQLFDFCKENNIVSQFVRFNPILDNKDCFCNISENANVKDTIYIDTSIKEKIFTNMDSKNRNMVRKAEKANVKIIKCPMSDYNEFLAMYRETMNKHNADDFYLFDEKYFEYLRDNLSDNSIIFYAMLDDNPISGAVFLYDENSIHYHLAGMHREYQKLASSNLLLYEVAVWASENGFTKFHLGGGVDGNDSLFDFKKKFNKYGRLKFYIGKTIFDRTKYDYLLKLRKKLDPKFDINNSFMIQYRR